METNGPSSVQSPANLNASLAQSATRSPATAPYQLPLNGVSLAHSATYIDAIVVGGNGLLSKRANATGLNKSAGVGPADRVLTIAYRSCIARHLASNFGANMPLQSFNNSSSDSPPANMSKTNATTAKTALITVPTTGIDCNAAAVTPSAVPATAVIIFRPPAIRSRMEPIIACGVFAIAKEAMAPATENTSSTLTPVAPSNVEDIMATCALIGVRRLPFATEYICSTAPWPPVKNIGWTMFRALPRSTEYC